MKLVKRYFVFSLIGIVPGLPQYFIDQYQCWIIMAALYASVCMHASWAKEQP